jgi:two-component system chemotaxis response regulator CheB
MAESFTSTTPVVVIGAAAVELAETIDLLAELSPQFPAPVLIAIHSLAPEQSAAALTALSQAAKLTCAYAQDRECIIPGRVYIAPPDKHMLVAGDELRVIFGPKENCNRPALDPLFRTAAVSCGSRVIAVVLSALRGTFDDGLLGLSLLKECGGTVVLPRSTDIFPVPKGRQIFRRLSTDHTPYREELPALLLSLTRAEGGGSR